ncbi:hypothetical protein PR202_gb24671 [Eleusine coracana subsp. coracana]|uniref:Uncharacterized protein n=1 Tax=Eleusine coracana subsp. coracana TaxID=191504 RepID=A0AAV5FJA3_ELECO|nr:hypothetical protein PR202_gb24671 [Eleusine coracana subsp. coracana]
MGSVLSAAHAAVCSFADAQLDKAEARRLMAIYPGLRDMPADELEIHLRRLIDERKEQDKHPFDSVVYEQHSSNSFFDYLLILNLCSTASCF